MGLNSSNLRNILKYQDGLFLSILRRTIVMALNLKLATQFKSHVFFLWWSKEVAKKCLLPCMILMSVV